MDYYVRTEVVEAGFDDDSEQEVSTISESCGSCDYSYSAAADPRRPPSSSFADELGLMELLEGDKAHDLIFRNCKSGLGDQCQILSVLRNGFRTVGSRAKFKTFQIFQEAVHTKHAGEDGGGGAKVKYGWCAVAKQELKTILEYGFSQPPSNDGSYGRGLYLSPDNSPLDCLKETASETEDGMRFLLLCRVLLGKSEIVPQGSIQSCPSSPEFDSGVDDLASPKKYIVWSTHMNTHVLPEFLVCIKAPFNLTRSAKRLRSPWMAFPVLIKALSKFLSPSQILVIQKHYKDQQNRRISRSELIQRVRSITGDKLLVHIIKAFGHKVQR
ncbi:PREDICTED: probable inactive poly [ADP-ribose] polymerase SRO5 [Camelina sativa]|uniref:Probable inactive poly [ADP-ribose] polymerase SRO5 n=1 Tax=Camelina sativa TaxID=90675 RepID=A0ABM0UPD0_CAMSA|nr:PREDICTED: probable inactive poly [ADP-ribose] polymerase SRO5 [Camelina sativa]